MLVILSACSITGQHIIDEFEMGSADALFVEPDVVSDEYELFLAELKEQGKNKRPLYEKYIDVLGANGILDGIEVVYPKCHSEAHDLGKVIYAHVQDIALGLRICEDRCYSGCMHGVLMEAFTFAQDSDDPDGHIDFDLIKPVMNELCYENEQMVASYSPGDCAHGVGHALMFLSYYDVPLAVKSCSGFDNSIMVYYCATGAYMEYVTEKDNIDAKTQSLFYPCDTYDYPAACARYKSVHVIRRHYYEKKSTTELVQECLKLDGKFRIGCFHGHGNAHMGAIVNGRVSLSDVCEYGTDDDQFACIDGAMERMSKYHKAKALKVCDGLVGRNKKTCLGAVERGMYNMEKDISLYLAD